MRRFTIPLMAAALIFASCNQSTETVPNATETPPVTTMDMERIGNWLVIPDKSNIQFTATQQSESFTGEFLNYSVLINFKEDQLDTANVRAAIDLSSVSAGNKDRDGALPGKEWVAVKSFPEAIFRSDEFVKTGEGTYEARGTLSMKGTSHPVTLPFTLDINGSVADMTGRVTLDRTLWDVGSGTWASGDQVSTEVVVDIKISAESPF